jgi:tetratricopeptide (TPR) repeat protein
MIISCRKSERKGKNEITAYHYHLKVLFLLFLLLFVIPAALAANGAEDLDREGIAALNAGHYQAALETFDRAIAADPGYLPARINRGMALLSLGRAGEALLAFEVVLDRDPANVPAWIYRGDALVALGRNGEAAESYRTAERLEPGNPVVAERLKKVSGTIPEFPLPFSGGILVLLAGAGIVTTGVLALLITRRRKEKLTIYPSESEKKGDYKRRRLDFFFRMRQAVTGGSNTLPSDHVPVEKSKKPSSLSRAGGTLPKLGTLFSRKEKGESGLSPFPAGAGDPFSPGPLVMEGNVDSVGKAGLPDNDPVDGNQVIAGFDSVLANSGIDASGLKGISLYAMGRYAEALEALRRERQDPHAYPGVIPLEAAVLLKMDRPDDALALCEEAIRNNQGTFETFRVQAEILERLGRFEEAIRACDEALSRNPHSVDVWSLRARALHALHRDHEALQACERALGMDPFSPELIRQKSQILATIGRNDEAIALLESGIEKNPRETGLLLEKARILFLSGRPKDAVGVVDSALAISPGDHLAWRELATILHAMGEYPEEAAAWERASALSPGNTGYLVSWANALRDAGETLPAIRVYLKAVEKSPHDAGIWKSLGKCLYSAARYEDAAKAFGFVTGASPGDGEAWKCLGWAFLRAGMQEQAVSALRRAQSLLPSDGEVRKGLRLAEAAIAVPVGEEQGLSPAEKPSGNQKPGGDQVNITGSFPPGDRESRETSLQRPESPGSLSQSGHSAPFPPSKGTLRVKMGGDKP